MLRECAYRLRDAAEQERDAHATKETARDGPAAS
jgi:hypothetical protein